MTDDTPTSSDHYRAALLRAEKQALHRVDLAIKLQVPIHQLLPWLQGTEPTPRDVYLKALKLLGETPG